VRNKEQNILPLHAAATCRDNALLEFLELEASPVEGQSLQQKEKQRQNKITKIEEP